VSKLLASLEAPDPVYGLAVFDKNLYVLRKREDNQIFVYDTKDCELHHTINVDGLTRNCYNDLTACKAEQCLFLSDYFAKCIRKIDANGIASKFVDVPYEPKGLSITPDGHLLVCCNPNMLLELNAKTGETLTEVKLKDDIKYPKHAVKRKDGQYVVCHAALRDLNRVLRVGADGYYRHCFGGMEGKGDDKLNCPCHLALTEDNYAIVADNDNNRLVMLDPSLEYVGTIMKEFAQPHRLCLDSESLRLYVGDCKDIGTVKVFQTK